MSKNYKEVTGIILSCTPGYNAHIKIGEQVLTTSPVEKISMVWQGKFTFETENSIYVVNGAILQETKEDDLQTVYNKINTILLKSGAVLNISDIPALVRGQESRTLHKCSNIFKTVAGVI